MHCKLVTNLPSLHASHCQLRTCNDLQDVDNLTGKADKKKFSVDMNYVNLIKDEKPKATIDKKVKVRIFSLSSDKIACSINYRTITVR